VLASVLLGSDPPRLATPLLVRTAELFGIAEGTTRTALSRMTAAGELRASDGGYELAGRLRDRQARQRASRLADTIPWDGTWELAVVASDRRRPAGDRAALRTALTELRLAELREGVWTRPANLDPGRARAASALADGQVRWWRSARHDDGAARPERLWDLAGWARAADRLRAEMSALLPALDRGDTAALAEGFVTSASVLRHLQADPLLPDELLPGGWPGDALRRDYDRYDDAYRAVLGGWLDGR
jgi:phenylacetic acid degradation operon negative regulatory protein